MRDFTLSIMSNFCGCPMSLSKNEHKNIIEFRQCLPLVRVDMNGGEINIRDFGVPDIIRPKSGCPIIGVDGQILWVIRTIKAFIPHSQHMVLVNQFHKSRHFFYPLLQKKFQHFPYFIIYFPTGTKTYSIK